MDCRVHGVAKSGTQLSDFHFKPFWIFFFFVWCEWVSKLHWFISNCLAFPVPLSSIVYSCLLCRRLIDSRCVGLIWAFYSLPLIYTSVFVPVPRCFDYCSFVVLSEIWEDYCASSPSVSNSECDGGRGVFEPMTCWFPSCPSGSVQHIEILKQFCGGWPRELEAKSNNCRDFWWSKSQIFKEYSAKRFWYRL